MKPTGAILNDIAVEKKANAIYFREHNLTTRLGEDMLGDGVAENNILIANDALSVGSAYMIGYEIVYVMRTLDSASYTYLVARGYALTPVYAHSSGESIYAVQSELRNDGTTDDFSDDYIVCLDVSDPSFYDVMLEMKAVSSVDNSANSLTISYAFSNDNDITDPSGSLVNVTSSKTIAFPSSATLYYQLNDVIRPIAKYMYLMIGNTTTTATLTFSMQITRV